MAEEGRMSFKAEFGGREIQGSGPLTERQAGLTRSFIDDDIPGGAFHPAPPGENAIRMFPPGFLWPSCIPSP